MATLIAAIPSFITLIHEKPEVYQHTEILRVLNTRTPNYSQVKDILRQNGIPDSRIIVRIANAGDGPASEVKVGIKVSGTISSVIITPSKDDKPVWVELPNDIEGQIGKPAINMVFKNLAPEKSLLLEVGYLSRATPTDDEEVEVRYDGQKPATPVRDFKDVPKRTLLNIFFWPLAVVGIIALIIIMYWARSGIDFLIDVWGGFKSAKQRRSFSR